VKRWLPNPLLSASLLAMWLLLNPGLSPGNLLIGAILAWGLPRWIAPLRPAPGPMHKPVVLARLIARVGMDVVTSAIDVARGVLRLSRQPPRGNFVVIPLDLHDTHGLAALAVITTVIPGTVWSELAPDRSALLLHVFDVGDEEDFVRRFKSDYEMPLMEIFE
jgi:multicomponent K+:H+ antiporter subunit E